MGDAKRDELLDRVASAIGDDAFNRLLGSVKEVRQTQRLRFWQESLLSKAGVGSVGAAEFLNLFGQAKWRETGRPKDPLTAATNAILKPAIVPAGFIPVGGRLFARIRDGIVQYFALQLSTWGSRDFAVNYASMPLCPPREDFVIVCGGRLPRGKSGDGWWPSKHHAVADDSMRDVVERLTAHCLPWFERTSTTAGLLAVLLEEQAALGRPDASTLFDIACCRAQLGEFTEAQAGLAEASAVLRAAHDERREDTWILERVARCERLATAIEEGQAEELLAEWRAESVRNLKLEKLT